jgi:DNA modification methylase/REP element-mobilizing transposase RayT
MKNEQLNQQVLFDADRPATSDSGPVTCLGMTFPNDEERRKYFLGLLREKLKDPEFRKIEGFPIGSDEDILALSDPPYYTACPNPFIADFIKHYGKPYDPETDNYRREPFASDTGAGKTHPIYTAHSYHSKIPHLATMPCILHYTEPGDIVLDGFSGSGMTGVAAQLCGQPEADFKATLETEWKKAGYDPPKWGARRPILIDLSPVANFIAYNLNIDVPAQEFKKAADSFFSKIEEKLGWMYETFHVEPASSRLISALEEFTPCDPFQATKGIFRKDNLPHIQVPGATYFITFRTHDFRELSPYARTLALNAVRHWDNQRWKLFSAVVMPDHVHIIAKPLPKQGDQYWDLSEILHSIKSFSANKINELEEKTGSSVWQTESYDRIIRDVHELVTEITYIHYNPVQARLAKKGEEYAWRYMANELSIAGWKPAPLGKINYVVWSEVFTCPNCAGDVVFMDQAYDPKTGKFAGEFECPHCRAVLTTRSCEHKFTSYFDKAIGETVRKVTYVPVEIEYTLPGDKTKYRKKPDEHDLALINRLANEQPKDWFPTAKLPIGKMRDSNHLTERGITHYHQFYLPRALHALSTMWRIAGEWPDARVRGFLKFMVDSCFMSMSLANAFRPAGYSQASQYIKGVYYIPPNTAELSPWYILDGKYKRLQKMLAAQQLPASRQVAISTASSLQSPIPDKSVDYIYTDPPFGDAIKYGDLNLLIEAWHNLFSRLENEVLWDELKKKTLSVYSDLMRRAFAEYYRVLKPGRWMTVVFHNSKNLVWTVIQEAIGNAGFVIADVRTLDREQGSFNQVTAAGAVKQDLVISAYKPNGGLEERFKLEAGTEEGVWDFVRTHLKQLPVFVSKNGQAEVIAERQNYLLFDRMVAFHVQRGVTVPLSAAEFYAGLAQRFSERDGMYFLPEQVAEYDKKRMTVREVLQLDLFVTDESSAIQWLKQQLLKKPQTFQEIHPQFLKEIGGWQKHEKPLELSELLEQNFLRYDGKGSIPPQIVSWLKQSEQLRDIIQSELASGQSTDDNGQLVTRNPQLVTRAKDRWYVPDPNKAGDLEKLRERSLLKEFEDYRTSTQKRLKVFRLEAVRAGFKKAWQERDYATIITVARKIPENVLQEDPKLLMWYDQALTRSGEE